MVTDKPNKTKRCSICRRRKPLTGEFWHRSIKNPSGFSSYCKECSNSGRRERTRRRRRENPQKYQLTAKHKALRRNYGISPEEYEEKIKRQKGKCASCKKTKPLHVDHNHDTDEVRDLLCFHCNCGSGMFEDDSRLVKKMYLYLRRWEKTEQTKTP